MSDYIPEDVRRFNPPDRMMQWFHYEHLPPHLQEISKMFCILAEDLCSKVSGNPERTVALRKLLESKDAAVRALLESRT